MSAILPSTNLRPEPRSAVRSGLLSGITLNWETAAYIAILILAIFTRFYILGDRVMSHDESLHTQFSYNLYTTGVFQHTPLMHGPILFHVTAFFYSLFGDNDFSARIYPAILGVIMTAGFPLLFRRWLGKWGALLLALMLLISPIWMYYNRYIREDTPNIFYAFLMIYCFFMYLDGPRHLRRKARWLYICAAAMLFMMGSKETGFIYLAIFGSFMTLYWIVRLYQHIRKVPSRSLFNFIVLSVLVGGTVAVLMYVIFNIALQPYPTLTDRLAHLSSQISVLFSGAPISLDAASFFNWTLLLAVVAIAVVVATALWAFRNGLARARWGEVIVLLLLAAVICIGFIYIEELSFEPARAQATVPEAPGDAAPVEQTATTSDLPIIAAWVVAGAVIIGVLYSYQAGWWRTLHRFRELDMLILMGTLLLPWLTPVIIVMAGANPKDYSPFGIQRAILSGLPLLAISIVVGVVWNWRRWLIIAACFWIPFFFFFTTMFTNPNGIWTGVIGSLGYWLGEQATRRGSQPNYYYQVIVLPMYEFLPIIGSILAMLAGMVGFWRMRRQEIETVELADEMQRRAGLSAESAPAVEGDPLKIESLPFAPTDADIVRAGQKQLWLKRLPFVPFFAYLGVLNLIAYTLAGEKMPWLGTHMTIPMMFLTAWYFGTIFTHTDWSRFNKRGWLYLLLLPLLIIAALQIVQPFLIGRNIFGLMQTQLSETGAWIAAIVVVVVVAYAIWRVRAITGGLHLRHMIGVAAFVMLAFLTFRAAWTASFINYDRANEFLVYAHGAPGWRLMMDQIEDISRRTTNGMDIRFAWGGNAWPASWYFRHLRFATYFGQDPSPGTLNDAVAVYASSDIRGRVEPLLEDRYVRFDYTRMWWPMQDYFNLNAQRVDTVFDFSGSNPVSAQLREGLLDIWWSRDYTAYGQATGGDFSLTNWPVSETMSFYVRKDVAAQIWSLGVGDALAQNAADATAVNQCVANWQPTGADLIFQQPAGGALNHPVGISIGNDGRVYVADEFGNRVAVFNADGVPVADYISAGGSTGAFNRPNSVAVAPDGSIVVADTWNYRIQVLDDQGLPVVGWGQAGQFGYDAPFQPVDAFWGPRDVAVDANGNIYVADTGNKRIRVYDANGNYQRDIGSGGGGPGQLNEPSGLAISADGRLFVADTWNRRISVFGLDGNPQYDFRVRGWYTDVGNRPYLAFDAQRNYLYVSDPDAGRVLVYTPEGDCVGSFGQPGDAPLGSNQFQVSAGIAIDSAGNVYVVDSGANRVLRFPPFTPPESPAEGELPADGEPQG